MIHFGCVLLFTFVAGTSLSYAQDVMPIVPFQPTPNIAPLTPLDLTPRYDRAPSSENESASTESTPDNETKRRDGFIPLDRKKMVTRPINHRSPAIIRPNRPRVQLVRRDARSTTRVITPESTHTGSPNVLDVFPADDAAQ